MRMEGIDLTEPRQDILVIPRGEKNIIFEGRPVPDFDGYDEKYPAPKPPEILKPGGIRDFDENDPNYKIALDAWGQRKTNWLVLHTLAGTPGMTWDTVDFEKPETWENYRKELEDAGFLPVELLEIIRFVTKVNALSSTLIEQAKKDFLAIQAQQVMLANSQKGEQPSTPSGESAKD